MSKNKKKYVTNLLISISKARDLLTNDPTPENISANIGPFWTVEHNVPLCIKRYQQQDDYELDFTYHDLIELAQEIYDFISKIRPKCTFSKMKKTLESTVDVLTNDVLNNFLETYRTILYVDNQLSTVYQVLVANALILYYVQDSEDKKSLPDQMADAMKQYLKEAE